MAFFNYMENTPEKSNSRHRFSFKKEERLCSKKLMEKLFSEGNTFLVYPIKVVYTQIEFTEPVPAKAAFAVSKKLYGKAVCRNLIKRRMREAYRLNKHLFFPDNAAAASQVAVIFIYIGKEILDFKSIEKSMLRSLSLLNKKITPNP
jgi:ribonuclease P protein component